MFNRKNVFKMIVIHKLKSCEHYHARTYFLILLLAERVEGDTAPLLTGKRILDRRRRREGVLELGRTADGLVQLQGSRLGRSGFRLGLFRERFLLGHSLGLGSLVLFRQSLRLSFRRFASRRVRLLLRF